MAITASISLGPNPVRVNQPTRCVLNVANSGGSDLNIISAYPQASATGISPPPAVSAALGDVDLSTSIHFTVPAGGSVNLPFNAVFFGPSTDPLGAGTFTVGCQVNMQDGSTVAASTATIVVNQLVLQ